MAKIRQEINILDGLVAGAASSNVDSNERILLDTTKYNGTVTYYFEVEAILSSSSIVPTVSLRRSDGTSEASIGSWSTSYTLKRTSFTPPAGKTEYFIRTTSTTSVITAKLARIIVIQEADTLTNTETQIEVGRTVTTTLTAGLGLDKIFTYNSANWDGTITAYFEATFSTATSKSAGTVKLQVDDGSFGGWADVSNASVTTTSTTPVRVRASNAFTFTAGRHYQAVLVAGNSKSGSTNYNAKIIIDQIGGPFYLLGGDTDNLVSSTNFQGVGEAFESIGGTLQSAQFYLKINAGSPTGNATAKIYNITGTIGSNATPTGAALATSDTLDVTTLSGSYALTTMSFSGGNQISLTDGSNYAVTFEYSGGDGSNNVAVKAETANPIYLGNRCQLSAGSWASSSNIDLIFSVNTTAGSELTKIEPQYLLINAAVTGTGLKDYDTLWDEDEWDEGSGSLAFYHQIENNNTSAVAELDDIDNGNATLTNSSVAGTAGVMNLSSAITMPTDGHQIDSNLTTNAGTFFATRILVYYVFVGSTQTVDMWMPHYTLPVRKPKKIIGYGSRPGSST